ncbi:MAG: hypothetical protein JRH17_15190 [Deltaproteobacteria bacterium]|nr:hypothetical protein [Deltaproteobacteria bacterium]
MTLVAPEGLVDTDEYRHPLPGAPDNVLFGDTLWVSVVDPEAGVHGVCHWHLSNKGYARFESLFVIDGVVQLYGNKVPLSIECADDRGPWTDGRMTYAVIEPWNHIRITLDWEKYAYELDFHGRFEPWNYSNCEPSGDPMKIMDEYYGGHFEQAMSCTGRFEIRDGPNKGDVRQLNCWSHRDHTWTSRFNVPQQWEVKENHVPAHFWPSVQLPDRHINVFGLHWQNENKPTERSIGGFVSDKDGSRPLRNAKAELWPNDRTPAVRDATKFRYEFELPDGEIIHVKTTKKHGQIQLWLRAENDLENRMDCYEAFCDFEVEETGEVGNGTCEYSVMPVWPQWKA